MFKKRPLKISKNAEYILRLLNYKGFQAYFVGGCVRDSVIGTEPHDWDIATDALPEDIKSLFKKTIDTGIKHGTITVIENGDSYEITTFRIDYDYTDNRRPDRVEFTSLIEDDLSRRDFTINAIAYHPDIGFVDPFKGIDDISNKIINSVGNPDIRFSEDALRMLRAVRFSAQLGYEISDEILKSITRNFGLIKNVSPERINDELTKILISQNPLKFKILYETVILSQIIPELSYAFETEQHHPSHIYNVGDHLLCAVSNIDPTPVLRWAALLHDIGKSFVKSRDADGTDHFYEHSTKGYEISLDIMKRLRFDNQSTDIISRLVKNHDRQINLDYPAVRRAINRVGDDIFQYLIQLKRADSLAQNPALLRERFEYIDRLLYIYNDIKENKHCFSVGDLAISGNDLKEAGFKEGRVIGETLEYLLDKVLENPELNERKILLELVKNKI